MDPHMLAKVLRRTAERVERGWSQYGPLRLHGDRTETGCILQQLSYAYRDITGQPVALHHKDRVVLLNALEHATGSIAFGGLARWNDAKERTQAEAEQACYDAAAHVERGA